MIAGAYIVEDRSLVVCPQNGPAAQNGRGGHEKVRSK